MSFGGFRGTLTTCKRKLGSLFTVSGDLAEGELDPVANKKISHLTECFLYTSECISTDPAAKTDRLDLNERYSWALKACHDVSVSHSFSSCLPLFYPFFVTLHHHFHCFFLLQTAFYISHSVRDFSSTSAAQVEVEKLRGELKLSRSREEKLVEEVRALKGCLDDLTR